MPTRSASSVIRATAFSISRLERAVERLKPAHLEVTVLPGAVLGASRREVLHGGAMVEITGDDAQRGELTRGAVLTGGVLIEIRG